MDDQTKKQSTTLDPQDQNVVSDSQQPKIQVPSVGTGNKELGVTAKMEQVSERPVIDTEVSKYVEHSEPETPSDPKIGINPSGHLAAINPEQNSTKFSMTDAEIEEILKQGVGKQVKVDELQKDFEEKIYFADSKFFLARLFRKISDKAKQIIKPGIKLTPKPA